MVDGMHDLRVAFRAPSSQERQRPKSALDEVESSVAVVAEDFDAGLNNRAFYRDDDALRAVDTDGRIGASAGLSNPKNSRQTLLGR